MPVKWRGYGGGSDIGTKDVSVIFARVPIERNSKINSLADTGFQEIHEFHKNLEIPKKKIKRCPLTNSEKEKNMKFQVKE